VQRIVLAFVTRKQRVVRRESTRLEQLRAPLGAHEKVTKIFFAATIDRDLKITFYHH
jgi:hypothetical protein